MRIQVASFTARGRALGTVIFQDWKPDQVSFRQNEPLQEWTRGAFSTGAALVFIGAVGIAVRAVAPFVRDKLTDSPVVVLEETGQYVIPLLSGHVGGANELAVRIAAAIDAVPVLTTATDVNRLFAVDVFAKKNGFRIVNRDGIAKVSGKLLAGEKISMAVEGVSERQQLEDLQESARQKWGETIEIFSYPPTGSVDVTITTDSIYDGQARLELRPKEYVLGIGCRRGKSCQELTSFAQEICQSLEIYLEKDIACLASVDRKKDEAGLAELAGRYRIPFLTFQAEELSRIEGEFSGSQFVKEQIGVDNVCERAALAAAGVGGILIRKKVARDGMTLAVVKRCWGVVF